MARADDMANARPMYLDAMESANGIPREAHLSRPNKRPLPGGNVLVLNHAERVVSRMMKRARGPRSVWCRRGTSSAAPWTRGESRARQNERAQGPDGSEWRLSRSKKESHREGLWSIG